MGILVGSFLDGGVALAIPFGRVSGIVLEGGSFVTAAGGGKTEAMSAFRCSNKSLWYACITRNTDLRVIKVEQKHMVVFCRR